MIELIFAIVIISISVLAIPTMTQVNATSMEDNIKQEAIFAASAKMMQLYSFYWDENSKRPTITDAAVLDTKNGNGAYARFPDNNSSLRVGHVNQENHRQFFMFNNPTSIATNLGDDNATVLGLDEQTFNNIAFTANGASATGYKKRYTTSTLVTHISDTPTAATFVLGQASNALNTNLKLIRVTVQEIGSPDPVVLYSYSANIGTFTYFHRKL